MKCSSSNTNALPLPDAVRVGQEWEYADVDGVWRRFEVYQVDRVLGVRGTRVNSRRPFRASSKDMLAGGSKYGRRKYRLVKDCHRAPEPSFNDPTRDERVRACPKVGFKPPAWDAEERRAYREGVAAGLRDGMSRERIAERLGISIHAVDHFAARVTRAA